ncbi:DUF45 domain-containing protein [Psychrobacter aquimaris]
MGSSSAKDQPTLHLQVIKALEECSDEVIVHKLCHIAERYLNE